jgi:tetratricopeptide (TPR) repeat protein
MNLSKIIQLFQKQGFLPGLSATDLRKIVQEMHDCNPSEVEEWEAPWAAYSVFESYYSGDRFEQGLRDGYIMHSYRFGKETDDVVAELSMMLGSPPLYVQTSMGDNILYVTRDDGEQEEINCSGGFDDVVQFFNATLKERKSSKIFYEVDSGADATYLCLTKEQYQALSKIFFLPTTPSKDVEFKKVMERKVGDGWSYIYRAQELEKLKKDDLALLDYKQVKRFSGLEPKTLSDRILVLKACLAKARLCYAANEFSECVETCNDILPSCTDKDSMFRAGRDLLLFRGRAYSELGKTQDALRDFDTLIADNEWDADAYFYRAMACRVAGDEANAEKGMAKAKELGCSRQLV